MQVADANGCIGGITLTIVIDPCNPITISPTALPDGNVNTPYSVTLTASGGTAPYTWAVGSGALPVGLSLDANTGVISGVPTTIETANFSITVTDATGCAFTVAYTVNIGAAVPVDFVVGEGLGDTNTNRVRVYDATGTATIVDFQAYGAGKWGTNVTSDELNSDGIHEIVTGPGPGDVYGPHVRAFRADGTSMGKINFFAYGTLKFGVNVAADDLDADIFAEILSGAGPGAVFGPHVRGWNFDDVAISAIARINFFAYGTLKFGVNVSSGDLEPDTYAELLTGAGPGQVFGPQVRAFNYDVGPVSGIAKINFNAFGLSGYGCNVAAGDVDGDVTDEIGATPGPGPTHPSDYAGWNFDGGPLAALTGFTATPYTSLYGGRIGLGDVSNGGTADLLTGPGRDPAAIADVQAHEYDGTQLTTLTNGFMPFTGNFGVNVTAGRLGY